MVLETGRSTAEVARDLGIHDGTLGNWVNACRRENPEPDQPLTQVERAGERRARERTGRRDPSAADGERVPEESRGLLRPDATVAMRCALIEGEKANYSIAWMCANSRCRARRSTPGERRRHRDAARRQVLVELLVTDALAMAITGGHAQAEVIFHSARVRLVHIGRVRSFLRRQPGPNACRRDRRVLGQRRREVVLRHTEE